jgi:thiol:disulfide interchange protein DsbC
MNNRIVASIIASIAVLAAIAGETAHRQVTPEQSLIASKLPPAKPEDVALTADGAFYEVKVAEGSYVYVTKDTRYMIAGDLYRLDGLKNLSEARRTEIRRELMGELRQSDLITFEAQGAKPARHSIIVFTDPDCTYCRKLQSEIDKITELGIRVQYAAYPRSGPGTDSFRKTEAVWCAQDRAKALTDATLDKPVAAPACNSPVAKHYDLGTRMGIRGTPMIVTESGVSVGGYLPPVMLRDRLAKLSAEAAGGGS